jgi:hypothetical protein
MVFLKKKSRAGHDYVVSETLGKRLCEEDVGIEIEVEGRHLIQSNSVQGWGYHRDGSLRGRENAEYVLNNPIKFDEVDTYVDRLFDALVANGAVLDNSNRTSVHVHLNATTFYSNRVTAFMALWFTFEELLTEWCGEHRVGNLFCLRAKDAQAIITAACRYVSSNGEVVPGDNFHYAALNLNALSKFGSIEVRTLRGVNDREILKTWVKILRKLYDASANYEDPRKIVENFSGEGPIAFMEDLFREHSYTIRQGCGMSEEQIRNSLYEGIRFAQDIVFSRDWSTFNPVKIERDVFGRKMKKPSRTTEDDFEHLQQMARLVAQTEAQNPFREQIRPMTVRTTTAAQWNVNTDQWINDPVRGLDEI